MLAPRWFDGNAKLAQGFIIVIILIFFFFFSILSRPSTIVPLAGFVLFFASAHSPRGWYGAEVVEMVGLNSMFAFPALCELPQHFSCLRGWNPRIQLVLRASSSVGFDR